MRITIETHGGTQLEFHDISVADKTVDFHIEDGPYIQLSYQIDKTEFIRVLKVLCPQE